MKKDTKSISGINDILNSPDSHPNSKDIVSLEDIEQIVNAGFNLYSWGSNLINFRKDSYKGFWLGTDEKGYNLQIQVLSDIPRPHHYNESLTKEFFVKRNVGFRGTGRLKTDSVSLTKALELSTEFESEYDNLRW